MTHTLEHLRVDHLSSPLALARTQPRFSWRVALDATQNAAVVQEAYQIIVRATPPGREPTIVADSGRIQSADCVAVPLAGFKGEPGQDYTWTLQVWLCDQAEPLRAEDRFGIARQGWGSPWAEPEQQPVVPDGPTAHTPEEFAKAAAAPPLAERLHPPRLLRQEFHLDSAPVRARLRATSQGVHHATLNGQPVSNDLLNPGYDSYNLALPVVTHDVTSLLWAGDNTLGLVLGDGWYAGRISFLGRSAQYGDILRASWELDIDLPDGTHRVIRPDATVLSSRGPIDWSDIFIGERHDARLEIPGWDKPGYNTQCWTPCRLVPFTQTIRPFSGEPVRRLTELPAQRVWQSPEGDWIIDFGQVIAGRVRMTVQGPTGTVIKLEHSEVVSPDGNFVQNILGTNKDQTDEYVLAGRSVEQWEPLFTYHGFRYIRVTGYPGDPQPEHFTAVVIGDDLEQTAGFESSDPRLNQLFRNVVWSQHANFLAVPTDCPQRERAGYTGDLQIFAPTAATLMGVAGVLERWLGTVRLEQARYGGAVPITSPEPPAMAMGIGDGGPFSEINAAAGWADAITIAPWTLWEHYGDDRFLADNVQAMRDWVAVQTREAREQLPPRLRGVSLDEQRRQRQELLWNGGFHFGDWVTPSTMTNAGADVMDAVLIAPRLTSELVAPMFQARSLDLLAKTLDVLGEHDESSATRNHAQAVRDAFTAEYLQPNGMLEPDLQGMYVLALAFAMVPADREPELVEHLVRLIHTADNHLDTGFLSTPYLLDVLWEHGHADLARTLLWQDTCPSWLYEVTMGATTIWESWHAIHEDGTAETTSMNHYAFGCVVDWIMRRLAGLAPTAPGYRTTQISPDLDGPLTSVTAHVETPYGRLAISWHKNQNEASLNAQVPVGVEAEVTLPAIWTTDDPRQLSSGTHHLTVRKTTPDPTLWP